ncbi:hypothetical protein JCM14036_00940 [Desulfotomaculum defluvii]
MFKFKKIFICLLLIMTLMGCQNNENKVISQTQGDPQPQAAQTSETVDPSINNVFDPLKTKVGDSVAGLKVKAITYNKDYPSKDYPAEVEFSGKIQLTGNLIYHDEKDEFLPDCLTFDVSEESIKNIPRLTYDERKYWFAFSDQDKAAEILGKKNINNLTIIVNDYKVWYAHTEVCDLANIVEVIKK